MKNMNMGEGGGRNFISGVFILSLSTLIVKVIGLAFKIPMLSLLGMGLLMALAGQQEGDVGRTCKSAVSIIIFAILLDKVFDTVLSVGESLSDINEFFSNCFVYF